VSESEQPSLQPSNLLPNELAADHPVRGYWLLTGQYRDSRTAAGTPMLKPVYRWVPSCMCAQCLPALKRVLWGVFEMILCPVCGNKRCPHANDHRNACTASNAPGQAGSRY